jgi:hypothetical protein
MKMSIIRSCLAPVFCRLAVRMFRLIHAAVNFAAFLAFRGLSINESTFWRMVWK